MGAAAAGHDNHGGLLSGDPLRLKLAAATVLEVERIDVVQKEGHAGHILERTSVSGK
jgi:hypothetical protein